MSINACIYDTQHNLVGCITDSVIERFNDEFETLKQKHFGDDVTPILGIMEKSLIQSRDKMSADFLNCLKLLSRRHRDDAPLGFVQEVSRAYHALVRYCCSQQVHDEVLAATIGQLRDAGLEYVGADANGFDQSSCLFEHDGWKVLIEMRDRENLYKMWTKHPSTGVKVTVTRGSDEYFEYLSGTPASVAEAVKEFIGRFDEPEMNDEQLLENLIVVIESLLVPTRDDC